MNEIIDPEGDALIQHTLSQENTETLLLCLDQAKRNEDRVTIAYVTRELRRRSQEKFLSA